MAPPEPVVVLTVADRIAEIRFNRPKALNAVNVESAIAFRDSVATACADLSVRVIVLAGNGRAFMAGGDLGYLRDAGEQAPAAAEQLIEPIHAAVAQLAAAGQPVLASVHGPVAGAGMSLALCADLAIAADDAVFNLAYVKIGNSPDCSATWTLPRLVGLRKALEIALLADNIGAAEALRLGLVNRVVPAAQLIERTREVALRLAASSPAALKSTKWLMRHGLLSTLPQQLAAEAAAFTSNAGSADFREALDAFFAKRPPVFRG